MSDKPEQLMFDIGETGIPMPAPEDEAWMLAQEFKPVQLCMADPRRRDKLDEFLYDPLRDWQRPVERGGITYRSEPLVSGLTEAGVALKIFPARGQQAPEHAFLVEALDLPTGVMTTLPVMGVERDAAHRIYDIGEGYSEKLWLDPEEFDNTVEAARKAKRNDGNLLDRALALQSEVQQSGRRNGRGVNPYFRFSTRGYEPTVLNLGDDDQPFIVSTASDGGHVGLHTHRW